MLKLVEAQGRRGILNVADLPFTDEESAEVASSTAAITPLRERDLQVLVDLFTQEEIESIEADILQNLLWRCPEPCWDDELDFLKEYL